jgi:hypothetical protein
VLIATSKRLHKQFNNLSITHTLCHIASTSYTALCYAAEVNIKAAHTVLAVAVSRMQHILTSSAGVYSLTSTASTNDPPAKMRPTGHLICTRNKITQFVKKRRNRAVGVRNAVCVCVCVCSQCAELAHHFRIGSTSYCCVHNATLPAVEPTAVVTRCSTTSRK